MTAPSRALEWLAMKMAPPFSSLMWSRPSTFRRQKVLRPGNSRLDCSTARVRRKALVRAHELGVAVLLMAGTSLVVHRIMRRRDQSCADRGAGPPRAPGAGGRAPQSAHD